MPSDTSPAAPASLSIGELTFLGLVVGYFVLTLLYVVLDGLGIIRWLVNICSPRNQEEEGTLQINNPHHQQEDIMVTIDHPSSSSSNVTIMFDSASLWNSQQRAPRSDFRLADHHVGSYTDCPICLEDLLQKVENNTKNLRMLQPCKHMFHENCIQEWMKTRLGNGELVEHNTCPICRATV